MYLNHPTNLCLVSSVASLDQKADGVSLMNYLPTQLILLIFRIPEEHGCQ
jgi:hypothetical protein